MKKIAILLFLISVLSLSACTEGTGGNQAERQQEMDPADAVFYKKAVATQSADLCNEIKNAKTKELCVADLNDGKNYDQAIAQMDEGICETIMDAKMKVSCQAEVKIGKKVQDKNNAISAEAGKLNEIIENGGIEGCDELKMQANIDTCKMEFIYREARNTNDAGKCDALVETSLIEQCKDRVQNVYKPYY